MNSTKNLFAPVQRVFATLAIFALVFSPFANVQFANAADPKPEEPKVKICHATASNSKPYNSANADETADAKGHAEHTGPVWFSGIDPKKWGDIIPPFDYPASGNNQAGHFDGLNWDAAGQAIWNNDCNAPAKLTLIKSVLNDNGGTDSATAWTLSAVGATNISGVTGASSITSASVNAGTYTLSETGGPTGYTPSLYSCVKNSNSAVSGNSITLENGDSATCTITNDDKPATLTLIKNVVGGTDSATAWTLSAVGATNISGVTGASSITSASVNAGTYTLSETGGPTGYTPSLYSCVKNSNSAVSGNSITLANGDSATCTITNTKDVTPTETCSDGIKNQDETGVDTGGVCGNGGGGEPTLCTNETALNYGEEGSCVFSSCIAPNTNLLSNASFEIGGNLTTNGTWGIFTTVSNWISSLTEGIEVWRNFNGSGVDVASDGVQNIELDGNAPTKITQSVTTVPGATYELRFDFSPRVGTNLADNSIDALVDNGLLMNVSGDGSTNTANTWSTHAKTFVASGTSTNIGFEDKGTANSLGSLMDNAVLCLVDLPKPTLTLIKNVVGGTDSATAWTLSAVGATNISGTTGASSITSASVNAGTYALSETGGPTGYTASLYSCVKNSNPAVSGNSITLANGDSATCTITNTKDVTPTETCSDGIKNQDETGVDTGGVCGNEEPQLCTVTLVSGTDQNEDNSDDNTTVTEKSGAFAKLLSFVHPAWTAAIAGASWIWGDNPVVDPSVAETQTFERKFGWNGPVTNAKLYVASDNQYTSSLNGSASGDDVNENNFQLATQDSYDVTSLIASGNNELNIAVTNAAADTIDPNTNPAGLMYKLVITGTNENCDAPYEEEILGCTDETALNYNEDATEGNADAQKCEYSNGGGGDEEKYLVFGNVWNDVDKDGVEVPHQEEGEGVLSGWTITITNGETTLSTTTDSDGYYYFNVPAGTWTISDGSPSEWNQTYPINEGNVHTVTVPELVTAIDEVSVFAMIKEFIIPTAYAVSAPSSYGPFNFGNVAVAPTITNTGGGGGGSSGGSSRRNSHSGGGEVLGDATQKGEVLGDATSTLPVGAPNTGAGGTSPVAPVLPSFFAILSEGTGVRRVK